MSYDIEALPSPVHYLVGKGRCRWELEKDDAKELSTEFSKYIRTRVDELDKVYSGRTSEKLAQINSYIKRVDDIGMSISEQNKNMDLDEMIEIATDVLRILNGSNKDSTSNVPSK